MQDLLEGYQLPSWPKTKLDRDLWNAVMGDIHARLKARELLEASFELLQQQGIQAALDYIQVSVAPQLSSLQDAIASAQAAIDEILGGNAPNAQRLGGQLPAYYATAQALAEGLATKANAQEITALIEQRVADLVDSSPAALDTLRELAAALGNDPNFATTVTDSIAKKLSIAGGTITGWLVINGGATLKADALIEKNYPQVRHHYPGVRIWATQVREDGKFWIFDETGGAGRFYIGADGSMWTSQLGDINSRIESRASAWAATRQALPYAGYDANNTEFPIGSYVTIQGSYGNRRQPVSPRLSASDSYSYITSGGGALLNGTWVWAGTINSGVGFAQRIG